MLRQKLNYPCRNFIYLNMYKVTKCKLQKIPLDIIHEESLKIFTKKARIYSVNPEAASSWKTMKKNIFSVYCSSRGCYPFGKPQRRIFSVYIVHLEAAILRGK